MKVGDLVEFSGRPKEAMGRHRGIITATDVYYGMLNPTIVIEVLWNNGSGWILQSRTRTINESR